MHCTRCHFLLSLDLDGRLSSARRDSMLTHLESCEACARLADEMREAQRLTLHLEPARVSRGFHESLWQRIEAGEGTPDAVFREPVPVMTRLRYLATGAAAAALFLVGLHFVREAQNTSSDDSSAQPVARSENDSQHPAESQDPSPSQPHSGLRERIAGAYALSTEQFTAPINPVDVAQSAQVAAVRNVHALKDRVPQLRTRLRETPAPRVVGEIEPLLRELRGSVDMLGWLADEQFVDFPGELSAEIKLTQRGLSLVQRASDRSDDQDLSVALQLFEDVRTEVLEQHFKVICCDTTAQFLDRLTVQYESNPSVGYALRFTIQNGSDFNLFSNGPIMGNPLRQVRVFRMSPQEALERFVEQQKDFPVRGHSMPATGGLTPRRR